MDPQQELFTKLKAEIESLGYDVYDGELPPIDTPYPFVYLGESQLIDDTFTKRGIIGSVYQTIYVWHNSPKKRGTVSAMLMQIKAKARAIQKTANFGFVIRSISQEIRTDNTTTSKLLQGVLTLEFSFS